MTVRELMEYLSGCSPSAEVYADAGRHWGGVHQTKTVADHAQEVIIILGDQDRGDN